MENWEHLIRGLGDKETCPFDGKSEDLWESQCDILQCSSRDQSIPMVTALPHCLLRAWLYSQKCTFPTQVSFAPLLVCFQYVRMCVGGITNPNFLRSMLLAYEAGHFGYMGNKLLLGPSWGLKIWACLCLTVQPGHPMEKVLPFVSIVVSSPCPGLHPHQTPAPLPNPGLYPPPVSMSPGQPPPQQLLAPTYFSAPGVMNFGNPSYPYAPGALPPPPPPHLYPNTQVRWLMRFS